jgi:hypothetical protein
MPEPAPLDPERVIRVLAHHKVRYVLIGALAARLYGFPRVTADIDITPDRDPVNLKRLAAALRELEAKVYSDALPEGLEFDCSAATLSRAAIWNLVTSAGRLDVVFAPAGTDGYPDLAKEGVPYEAFGIPILAASLQDIIRSKVAADRPQDRADVPLLRAILRRHGPGHN